MYDTNRISKVKDTIIFVGGTNYWDRHPYTSSMSAAQDMTSADFEQLILACDGDLSKIDPITAQAMFLYAQTSAKKRKERAQKAKEARAEKAKAFHEMIIKEIVDLMEGSGGFTTSDIQIAAQKAGMPVRTRQMYATHICMGFMNEGPIEYCPSGGEWINVIRRDGSTTCQRIPRKYTWRVR